MTSANTLRVWKWRHCFVAVVICVVFMLTFYYNLVPSFKMDVFVFEHIRPPPPAPMKNPSLFPTAEDAEEIFSLGKEGGPSLGNNTGKEMGKRVRVFDLKTDCLQLTSKGYLEDEHKVTLLSPLTTNDDFLIDYFHSNDVPGAKKGVKLRREVLEHPRESSLLCSNHLTTLQDLPDLSKSQVSIVDRKDNYTVGDEFQIRLDLLDGRGRRRNSGGDEVRMWLRSPKGENAVPLRVLDLGNGSYVGVTELMFEGVTLVRVSLTFPREFLRYCVVLRHTLHSLHWITGVFRNGRVQEKTPCLPYVPVPGYATACNLTKENGGFPWFCGRPAHSKLTCSDWQLTGNFDFLTSMPKTAAMAKLEKELNYSPKLIPLVQNDLTIITSKATPKKELSPLPCWSIPREETWSRPTPRGWLEGGAWRERGCTLPSELNSEYVANCLRNTGLLLVGDSNQGLFHSLIREKLQNKSLASSDVLTKKTYHSVTLNIIPGLNGTLIMTPHAKPFNVGTHSGKDLQTRSLEEAVELLLSCGRENNVVVIHYYVHNSFYPLYLYRMRVRYAKQMIEKVLTQRPKVKVMIRGPHVIYLGKQHHAQFGDNFATWFTQVWKEEFFPLRDKVWFLDLWDLTVAMENPTSHPPKRIVVEMVKTMFGYLCQV